MSKFENACLFTAAGEVGYLKVEVLHEILGARLVVRMYEDGIECRGFGKRIGPNNDWEGCEPSIEITRVVTPLEFKETFKSFKSFYVFMGFEEYAESL